MTVMSGESRRPAIRLVLVGDPQCGKTSLCSTLVSEAFPTTVPAVMHPIVVPDDIMPDRVNFTLVDTSSRSKDAETVNTELQSCDAVVVVCSSDRPDSIERVTSHWLPHVRHYNPDVPIAVAINKIDLVEEADRPSFVQHFQNLVDDFSISTCIGCSAKIQVYVPEVFYYALKSVTHPIMPIYDCRTKTLTKRFIMALTRIFRQCDLDMDGKLSSEELDSFQDQCFEVSLKQTDLCSIRRRLKEKNESFVEGEKITLQGFFYLHQLFIERRKIEVPWTVLRAFGYDDALEIKEGHIDYPHHSVSEDYRFELVENGLRWLYNVFKQFDRDQDGVLSHDELQEIFFPCPGGPPFPPNYENYISVDSASGGLTLAGWLSQFALLAFFDVRTVLLTMTYLGYPANRTLECVRPVKIRASGLVTRNTIHCIVFGSSKCGKSAFLERLLGKHISPNYHPTQTLHTVANMVDVTDIYESEDETKFLIMTEVPAISSVVNESISKDVPYCDLVLLMYDVSDPHSLAFIVNMMKTRPCFNVPHIMLANKSDKPPVEQLDADGLPLCPLEFSQDYNLVALSSGSYRDDLTSLFKNITEAALLPDGFKPSTRTQRQRMKVLRWIKRGFVLTTLSSLIVYASFRFNVWAKLLPATHSDSKKRVAK